MSKGEETTMVAESAAASSATSSSPVTLPSNFSADAWETSIRLLKDEKSDIRRRANRGTTQTADKMRTQEIDEELKVKESELKYYRQQARGVALTAFAVLLFIALIWVLMGWDNPLLWMENMNKQARHDAMMKATGGPNFKLD